MVTAACAHAPDLAFRPDPTPPAGSTTEQIAAADGTALLARAWLPKDEPKAVVVIVHGLKDHSARYASLASRLAEKGYAVYAYDLRGHGRSAGPRVAPADWKQYVDDTDRFLAHIEEKHRGVPMFLFGHSMGGAIAARTAEVHRPIVDGLVLSGPAIQIDAPPLLIAATRLTGFVMPKLPALKLDDHDFSSDPAAAAAIAKDPLISDPPAPARTAAGLVAGMHDIWTDADRLTMPLLAMHGSADRLTAPSGSRALVQTVPAHDKTLRIYDGYFHDLLHEPGGKGTTVENDVIAWIDAHAAADKTDKAAAPAAAAAVFAGPLAGDPKGWTQSVQIVAGTGKLTANLDRTIGFAGRFALDVARPEPFGYYGSFTAHVIQGKYAIALRPVGAAYRYDATGTTFGISAGGSLLTGTTFALSTGAWLEQPLGPLAHVSGFAQLDYRSSAIELFGWSLRFGEDERYWPHAHAGVGPVVSAGGEHANVWGWFATLGVQLYGAD